MSYLDYIKELKEKEAQTKALDGLWGNPFAIAAIVYDAAGNELDKIILRLRCLAVKNEWVIENVLPAIGSIKPTHDDYETMLKDFAAFYMKHKADCECICHMGYIVEAHLLREMQQIGAIGDWDAPYPLFDISGNLQAAGEDPTSVDKYVKKHNLQITDYGTTHNPLYDSEVAGKVYLHLRK